MEVLKNRHRGVGLPNDTHLASGRVSRDPEPVLRLLDHCPAAQPTPLLQNAELAQSLGIGTVLLKDERLRMGLGSFKALGAAYVLASDAAERLGGDRLDGNGIGVALQDRVYVCASAGNHGLSLAAGARVFGAQAVIYLSKNVPDFFAKHLQDLGARVIRIDGDYEASMAAAQSGAEDHGWTLVSDSSWQGYVDIPRQIMQGYLVLAAEVLDQLQAMPSHIFLQAGVGGLAAAATAFFRQHWGDEPIIVVVEPEAAPALFNCIRDGELTRGPGPVTNMGRLDCKEPSHLALRELAREADYFVTIDDACATNGVEQLAEHGITTTASGAAGFAALVQASENPAVVGMDAQSRVLAIVTEGQGGDDG